MLSHIRMNDGPGFLCCTADTFCSWKRADLQVAFWSELEKVQKKAAKRSRGTWLIFPVMKTAGGGGGVQSREKMSQQRTWQEVCKMMYGPSVKVNTEGFFSLCDTVIEMRVIPSSFLHIFTNTFRQMGEKSVLPLGSTCNYFMEFTVPSWVWSLAYTD